MSELDSVQHVINEEEIWNDLNRRKEAQRAWLRKYTKTKRAKAVRKSYQDRNVDKIRENRIRWSKKPENAEKHRKSCREYYWRNREKILEKARNDSVNRAAKLREYRKKNHEYVTQQRREWVERRRRKMEKDETGKEYDNSDSEYKE